MLLYFSFNRAVNIHGTHYVNIYNNVIYDIMGGAIFLEDGIEIGNIFDVSEIFVVKGNVINLFIGFEANEINRVSRQDFLSLEKLR